MKIKYPETLGNKQWLQQKYEVEKLSLEKIKFIVGCSIETVWRWMRKHNIRIRTFSEIRKGRRFSEETKRKISLSALGNKRPLGCVRSEETRRKISESQRGEKSHQWKGGTRTLYKIIRQSLDYRLWRESVFKRDNFTCQFCGIRGGNLEADHIKPFCNFPGLRFDISNGRTLCKECHRKTETWGAKAVKITA